jgi:nitrate/nitrite transporter NarK
MAVVVSVESDFSSRKIKIAGICLLGQLFGSSMLLIGPLSMMMVPITKEFGWSRFQFSFATSAVMWAGALAYPLFGRLIDRRGVRPVVLSGTFIIGLLSLALANQTASLWLFWFLYALVGVFGAIAIGYGKIIGSLFTQHRGKAMALITVCSSVVASIFPQISNQLLQAFGWRGIFNGYGIAILITGILLCFLLEEPAGSFASAKLQRSAAEKGENQPAFVPSAMEGMTVAEALHSRALWIMIASGLAAGILGAGWSQHSWAFQLSRGFSNSVAANAMSVSLLIAQIAVLLGGWLLDRVQTAKIKTPFILLGALSIYLQSIVYANYGGAPLLFTAITLSTMALNVQMPMLGYFYTRFFGMKAFGEIAGINMAILSLVAGFSAPLVGILYDRTGSYHLALMGMIVGYVISGLLYLCIGPYRFTMDFKKMKTPEKVNKPLQAEA